MESCSPLDVAGLLDAISTGDQTTAVYTPLESDRIRLVRILPQSQDDPASALRCTMRDFHLDDLPAYSALSYAWGGKPASCRIILNGQCFDVRKNLFRFLSHARDLSRLSAGWLFIDAISINQTDDVERSYQVSLMSRIYSGATRVIAWLGPQYAASDLAMRELGRKASYWHKRRNMLAIWSSPSGAAIRALCSRPYWKRLWVFQELSLAKEVQLVCGTVTIPWDDFKGFTAAMQSVVLTPRVVNMCEYQAMCASPAVKMVQHAFDRSRSTELWDLMFGLGHLRCAEPRDKVYALLGVAGSTCLDIQPDYHRSLPELLNQVLQYRHDTIPPKDLAEVETQRVQLEILLGVEERTTYIMTGQRGLYPAPSDGEVAAAPFAWPRTFSSPWEAETQRVQRETTSISLWWASFYGHTAVEDLLLAEHIFGIRQELITAVNEDRVTRLKMLLALKHVKTQLRALDVRVGRLNKPSTGALSLSLLELAVRRGHTEIATVLLDTGRFDVEAALADHFLGPDFLLYAAIRQNDVSMVEAILNAQDVAPQETRLRESPLDVALAIASGSAVHRDTQYQIVKLLVDSGKINIPRHALHVCRSPEIGRLLLNAGAYHGSLDQYGPTALQSAIKACDPGMVRLLLDIVDTEVASQTEDADATTLQWTVSSPPTLSLLIDSGRFNLNAKDGNGRTLLSHVAFHSFFPSYRSESTAVGKLLVNSNEVDINTRDSYNTTPLRYAAQSGNADLVGAIFHSDRLDLPAQGPSALNDAAKQGSVMITRMMIDSGKLDPNALAGGQTALHNAVAGGHQELVKMLLDSGKVDPNIKDSEDRTALQLVVEKGYEDIAKLLRVLEHDSVTAFVIPESP
ncbi:hypothetical protein LTR17_024375 [Elasticomyces elasticus]|nr:hypothetical protein LTR17_024375 [Elasticomyces elasticus]